MIKGPQFGDRLRTARILSTEIVSPNDDAGFRKVLRRSTRFGRGVRSHFDFDILVRHILLGDGNFEDDFRAMIHEPVGRLESQQFVFDTEDGFARFNRFDDPFLFVQFE